MLEQIGSAMWLGLCFAFHPTVFSAIVTYLPTAVFVEDINKVFDSFNCVKRAFPGKTLCSPLSDNILKDGKSSFKKLTDRVDY